MIQAIIFDLGGVLFTNGTSLFAKHVADKYNKDQKVVYKLLNYSKIGNAYREGKISRDQFFDSFKKELQIEDDTNELEKKWIEVYQIIEETKNIINQLKLKYKIYYLSDNSKERVEAANKKYGFVKWFDGGVFSHVVGVRKPKLKIYKIALKEVGFKPEEILFIDDKEINLPPAEKLGIRTMLYKNPEQLKEELKTMMLL